MSAPTDEKDNKGDRQSKSTSTIGDQIRNNAFDDKSDNNTMQSKIDLLLKLVSGRAQGLSNDDQVEDAVSSLLSSSSVDHATSSTTKVANAKIGQKPNSEIQIVHDEEDYDDLEKNDTERDAESSTVSNTTRSQKGGVPKWTGKEVSVNSIKKQNADLENKLKNKKSSTGSNSSKIITPEDGGVWKDLDEIPLGRMGARMMVTFGDGPNPNPIACSVALLATRQCLQSAIKDARALRRKMKAEYLRARASANLHRFKKKERSILEDAPEREQIIDPELFYSAIGGTSSLTNEVKCGFDIMQLEKLFPEEMFAYQKWKKMHKAYKNSKDDTTQKAGNAKNNTEKDETMKNGSDSDSDEEQLTSSSGKIQWGGHIHKRLAQFDIRTEQMKEDWYIAFSEVRQGSFISRSFMQEDREWEKNRKSNRTRGGGGNTTTWEQLPSAHVQFLHWIGFDPRSSLPLPKPETTEALAFLGYDFMGKIVEKAIFLRCLEKMEEETKNESDKPRLVLQLEGDEQLTEKDIDKAIKDSTVIAKPLYNASNSVLDQSESVQLYFGPGCENRIEMEMEQIIMGKKRKVESEEEKKIRLEEDQFFKKIKAPPALLEGILDVLGDEHKTEAIIEKRLSDKKRRRDKSEKRATALKNAVMNIEPPDEPKPKKRGRKPIVLVPLKK